MARTRPSPDEPTIVKKYANRRLYDTGRSSYVTLDDLCEMVQEGHDFVVVDAKSGEDLTRSVLTQIIVEQESKGENLLPVNFLRQLISFYGDKMQAVVPNYLEQTLDVLVKNQEKISDNIHKSFEGGVGVFGNVPSTFEDMQRQNMEIFERTMKMFTPFGNFASSSNDKNRAKELEEKINELQKELKKIKT